MSVAFYPYIHTCHIFWRPFRGINVQKSENSGGFWKYSGVFFSRSNSTKFQSILRRKYKKTNCHNFERLPRGLCPEFKGIWVTYQRIFIIAMQHYGHDTRANLPCLPLFPALHLYFNETQPYCIIKALTCKIEYFTEKYVSETI